MRVEEGFQQPPFDDSCNPYLTDPILPSLLRRLLPPSVRQSVEPDLVRLGNVLVEDIRPLSPLIHPASLTQYDHWGRRIDDLHTSEGWRMLEEFAIREGYVAIPYEREYKELSRIYSFFKIMIMTGDCHVIMCPMGMTDGAARTLELYGTDKMKRELLPKLISRNPSTSYLSGQWMTERPGGSDLSLSETTATPTQSVSTDFGPSYLLDGFKWFSSAAEGNLSVALARTFPGTGTRGLSLFVVPLRHGPFPSPLSNGVQMHRLKNKVGTHGVPTAELSLQSTRGWLIGNPGEGVKAVATILNVTRIHSAIHCVGSLQRCIAIAREYARVRRINTGQTILADSPLHVATLAESTLLYRALTYLSFGAVELLGKTECGIATEEDVMRLRMLTPAIKAYAAVKCPTAMEEMMGALGGLGYMEEVGMGRLIRDVLVERIWEGTINVLALDLGRATKDGKTVVCFMDWAKGIVDSALNLSSFSPHARSLQIPVRTLSSTLLPVLPGYLSLASTNPLLSRPVLNYFVSTSCALYLLEHAVWAIKGGEDANNVEVDVEAFRRWVEEGDVWGYEREISATLKESEHARRANMNSRMVYGATPGKEQGPGSKL